jgi:hypothetical protein
VKASREPRARSRRPAPVPILRAVSTLGAVAVLCGLLSAPAMLPSAAAAPAPVRHDAAVPAVTPAVMPTVEASAFSAQAAAVPADLVDALARDLEIAPEEYLARSEAAVEAVEVVESLGESGVEVRGSRLEGTTLVVNVATEADVAVVESSGAVAEVGDPEQAVDYSEVELRPMADLLGGQGYTFPAQGPGASRINHVCSIAFNGVSRSTGQRQFLTSGHCLTGGRLDGGGFFEARQNAAGSAVTRGSAIGTPLESTFRFGSGVDAGLVATAAGWTPRSLVSTWGGSNGAVTQGTPVALTQTTPGIVGAPVCKSGRSTGWTCGEVLELNFPASIYNGQTGTPVIVNSVLTSACMLEGDSGSAAVIGNAAFGVGTAGSWKTNCSAATQPDAISAFFPIVSTTGAASVTSAYPDWQLQTGSPYGNDWSPIGNFEQGSASLKTTNLRGWAFDPDTTQPAQIHVYVGGDYRTGAWGGAFSAGVYRPDVGTLFPGAGGNRGFSIDVPTRPGAARYCLYAINSGLGATTDLGCRTVNSPSGAPIGNLEAATLSGVSATLSGWAIDPDTAAPIGVHVYVNGAWGGAYTANAVRTDVGAAYPDYGSAHGFTIPNVRVPVGSSRICAYGIDTTGGRNTELGCRTVSTGTGPPVGNIDTATASIGAINLAGWALDPDTASPVTLHVYVDGGWAGQYVANTSRADVGRAYPGYGDNHGFSFAVPASGGAHEACVFGINVGAGGSNPRLACRTVTVPGGNPFGNIEAATRSGGSVTVKGWAIDPDVVSAIPVHVYVDGAWGGVLTANADRPDVGRAYPGYGAKHGYTGSLAVPAGARQVCVFGINQGSGSANPQLGCAPIR